MIKLVNIKLRIAPGIQYMQLLTGTGRPCRIGPRMLVLYRRLVKCEAWREKGRNDQLHKYKKKTVKSELILYQMSPCLQKCVNFINC